MRHYHGTPLGGTRDSIARFMSSCNRHFLVPFGRTEDLPIVSECSTGFILDNGAFSAWRAGNPITDWRPYYQWCLEWYLNPRFDFAIVPDIIDGSEDENNDLFAQWFKLCKVDMGWVECAPVWHLHETFERLRYLMQHATTICLGSSGDYATIGTSAWHRRMAGAMDVLCDKYGRPLRKIHGLRMLAPEVVERYPFSSADSTNVAQNSQLLPRFGTYKPATQSQRREVIASRMEAATSPSTWKTLDLQENFLEEIT